jgi:hypothetical protein
VLVRIPPRSFCDRDPRLAGPDLLEKSCASARPQETHRRIVDVESVPPVQTTRPSTVLNPRNSTPPEPTIYTNPHFPQLLSTPGNSE